MKQLTAEQKSKRDEKWHIVQRSPLSNQIENETGFVIAVVQHSQADVDAGLTGKTNSNAQLLVASRELLEACKLAAQWLEVIPVEYRNKPSSPIKIIREAINKASGKA